jgi:hypothetical protein
MLAITVAGCDKTHPATTASQTIDSDKFIEVYVDLRRASAEGDSTSDFDSKKQEILDKHGLSAQDLLDYIEKNSADLRKMTTIWDTIHQRLGRRDTTAGA